MSWFNKEIPYTGTGDKPKSSLPAKVTVTHRTADGKRIKPKPVTAKPHSGHAGWVPWWKR